MNGAFPSGRRLRKTDDFSSVFRMRPCARTQHFVMYARPNRLNRARLGIVVAKRFAPRAVTRNTVKRLCREVFRQTVLPSMDCLIRLSASVCKRTQPATGSYLRQPLHKELIQLVRKCVTAQEKKASSKAF
ncbi:MAG: ribonuclease P protein component [Oxalobacter sp.]|nr:ribonuclease P protein component [Oxalobacter sp.]